MRKTRLMAAGFAAALTFTCLPAVQAQAQAQAQVQQNQSLPSAAHKLRKLDIMLMVTALRCRNGPDNFQLDYQRFSARHLPALNTAHRDIKADLVARHGPSKAKTEMDRLSVSMANQYGQGHPWLGCSELARIAGDLADFGTHQDLLAAADDLLHYPPVIEGGTMMAARR